MITGMNDSFVITPTSRDVLNGRGQGVQRHPGNVKYRTLVFVNKTRYANCPRADKIKISKGIVAAIRELGGRFLELNEREGTYYEIGDKKATEKTSQALREGQTKIRKDLFKAEESAMVPALFSPLENHTRENPLTSSVSSLETTPVSNMIKSEAGAMQVSNMIKSEAGAMQVSNMIKSEAGAVQVSNMIKSEAAGDVEISQAAYFGYSLQVLDALHHSDHVATTMSHPFPVPAPFSSPVGVPQYSSPVTPISHAMAMALEQFPGARPVSNEKGIKIEVASPLIKEEFVEPVLNGRGMLGEDKSPFSESITDRRISSKDRKDPSFRLTDMSMGSIFSIRQLLEGTRQTDSQTLSSVDPNGSSNSVPFEIRELIRMSESQLKQIECMSIDELTHSQLDFDIWQNERVSDLRFTDMSKDPFTDYNNTDRNTQCSRLTKDTTFSRSSLMDASIMSIDSTNDSIAQILLNLSNEAPFQHNVASSRENRL